nr:hypothetical protein BaRGS_031196 [Batillaria attramentaria]
MNHYNVGDDRGVVTEHVRKALAEGVQAGILTRNGCHSDEESDQSDSDQDESERDVPSKRMRYNDEDEKQGSSR